MSASVMETLLGSARLAAETQAEMRVTDAVMHEVNGKIMGSDPGPAMRTTWHATYSEWCDLALRSPLLRDREPRISPADLRTAAIKVTDLKRRALRLYEEWKSHRRPPREAAVGASVAALAARQESETKMGKVMKTALIAAALLGGAAAARALYDSFRRKEPTAAGTWPPQVVAGAPGAWPPPWALPPPPPSWRSVPGMATAATVPMTALPLPDYSPFSPVSVGEHHFDVEGIE